MSDLGTPIQVPVIYVEPQEDKSYKVVITITETYDNESQALAAYGRFAGSGSNHVTILQGKNKVQEKDWGSCTDDRGCHIIDGKSRIIILDEHLHRG